MKHLRLMTAFLTLTACGPQAFVPSGVSSSQTAAGSMNIPPKVDIVLSVSSSGTMRNIISGINSEVPTFLQNLQDSGWDYRFVSIPLSEYHPTDSSHLSINGAVSVSKYDNNYPETSWLAPFPGALYTDPTLGISSYLFSNVFNVTQINANDLIDAHESGFKNQVTFLSRSDVKNNFLRPDATLAMITLTNSDDRSDWAWGAAGTTQLGNPTVATTTYRDQILATKLNPSTHAQGIVKYYSLVAHLATSCRGYGAWSGQRYESMTGLFGGQRIDICSTPLSSALAAVSADLQTVKLAFRKRFLVIGTPPNVGTIKVKKYTGGVASAATDIAQDPTNGWTYFGQATGNEYAIDAPIPMDLIKSGYLIELHGSAKLNGSDTADVTYQNAGTVSSH